MIEIIAKAKETVEEAIKLDKGGHKKSAIKLYLQAAEHYSLALRINPRHAGLHLFLGQIYLQYLEKPDFALEHFQASLEIDPNQPLAQRINHLLNLQIPSLLNKPRIQNLQNNI